MESYPAQRGKTEIKMRIEITQPAAEELVKVHELAKVFMLDDEDLQSGQFLIAKQKGDILGFGRLRHHGDALELCTLGVVEKHRGKGIGRAIVNALVEKTTQPVHVVCIIPGFFSKLGFRQVNEFPASMARKHFRCTELYKVPETYCVMQLDRT
jgi:N-acetylglutamate synthase-like GNAT family acetyltransferase